ncbi:hypothetical protein LRC484719_32700 [Mycobacterium riyadhense]
MASSSREEIVEVFNALDTELDRLCELSFDVFTTPERLRALERLERVARRLHAPQHTLINQLDAQATEEELGATLGSALADRLRITKAEASRRINEAADLGQRRALTGEPLAPVLTATAAAQRDGLIGDGHVREIRSFFAHLPVEVDLPTRQAAEADLAHKAGEYRPDELAKYAQRIMDWLNHDGEYSDEQRARKRGITIGKQECDGMSRISGYLTPEARATFEPVLAKLAAPGACNPEDETPVVDEQPSQEAVRRDTRSQPQLNHDALLAALRALLASGNLGQHNGLPVSIIATATLQDLQAAAGKGFTGGGSQQPMSNLIRMASHAHHSWPCSVTASHWRCITPRGWPPLRNESCSTTAIVDAASPAVMHRPTTAKSTTSRDGRRPTALTSTTSPWPAASTTDSPKTAGPPARTPTATPNGYRRHTSTTDNQGPIPIITRNDSSTIATTTSPFDVGTGPRDACPRPLRTRRRSQLEQR